METEAAENTPRNQDLGGDEEDAEEDEEDDFVDVGRSRFLQTMSLQQVPLGTILRLRLHSGKEHPQWPGGRLVIDAKDCRSVQVVFSTHSGLCSIQRHIQKHAFNAFSTGTFALAHGAKPDEAYSHQHCDYVRREAARQDVDGIIWQLDHVSNRDWALCSTYPEYVVLPVHLTKEMSAIAG